MRMSRMTTSWHRSWLLATAVTLAILFFNAHAKQIRLRNETIDTDTPGAKATALMSSAAPVTGLYLIQFSEPLKPEWKTQLRNLNVELLRFVPEDAYIAFLNSASIQKLRGTGFVRWIGPYKPEHRLDPRLGRAFGTAISQAGLRVKLLLSPLASPAEASRLARSLHNAQRPSAYAFGSTVTGSATPAQLEALARSPLVLWIEPAPKMRLFDEISTKIVCGDDFESGTPAIAHQLGFTGSGVIVAVPDSGFDTGEADNVHPDLEGRVDAFFAYGGLPDASDEHSHGTHVAGIIAGNAATGEQDERGFFYGLGVAPGAHLVIQRIFDAVGEYYPPDTFSQLTQDAVRNGAVIGSNSWGDDTQGRYDISAAEFDALVRDADPDTPGAQPFILEFSAGNSGPARQTIGSPAVAKNVIATGACQNSRPEFFLYGDGPEVTADFSSRGPCEDGRIKPDLMAPGTWIASLKSSYASDEFAWAPIDAYYMYQGGTSQAGPHVSGAAAIFVQYYRQTHGGVTPSPALVKAALINSADDMGFGYLVDEEGNVEVVGDTDPVPNRDEGWGRVNVENLITGDLRFVFVEQNTRLTTGQTWEQRVVVGPNAPLKITMVYTDVPGLPAAIPALVNDLDLEIVGPDGALYRGNVFLNGESIPNTGAPDNVNNVEAVHLENPKPGDYLVRIRARNVAEDINGRHGSPPEQDFALVISGDLPEPGEGIVFFDRPAYTAPANAVIRLIDQQLAGTSAATVKVTSTSEPLGETIVLLPAGSRGAFTNSVALVPDVPVRGDGRIGVRHGDTLRVVYSDADPPGERTSQADVDLVPPVLTGVTSTNRFGRTTVIWNSDEPASSRVVYGPPGNLRFAEINVALTQTHKIELPALEAGQVYQFYVVSADLAGNTSTNDNAGKYYTFVAPQAAPVLLLYSPESFWNDFIAPLLGEGPYPGIECWTDALDQLGVDYEIWDTQERNAAPTAEDLAPFRAVLWRPEELNAVPNGLVDALTDYLARGGSLCAFSFDLLSRLDSAADIFFKTNVLHIANFDEDGGAASVVAEPGDPVGGELEFDLDYSTFPDASLLSIYWPDGVDHIYPAADAAPLFRDSDGPVVGLRYPKIGADSKNRVVFCAFPFEAVPIDGPTGNARTALLGNILEFLVPGLRGLATIAFDRPAYTLPSAVTIEVTDAKRAGDRLLTVELGSPAETAPLKITLDETVRPGVFRTTCGLLPVGTPAGPTDLHARPNDTVTGSYIDSTGRRASTTALVDTTKPTISNIAVEPAYNEATVTWETSKPADALVQFGNSAFPFPINRTAYNSQIAYQHAVVLDGLLPDQEYVFSVTSRDRAGNTTVDDNRKKLYRFRTLTPLVPPWTDDLERGRTGWVVYNDSTAVDEETGESLLDCGWEYGVPQNSEGIKAHSGLNCWATNLKGLPVSLAISDLVSPAIDLTKGNRATLSFWHYYDFTERSEFLDIEIGQLVVSTNNGATWQALYSMSSDVSPGWEQVEIDLSRYAGHVVRFMWDYQMFSFEPYPRPGWLIDDVSVTVSTVPTGVVVVTNNLVQANFTISGPVSLSTNGTWYQIKDAPVGQYTVVWQPVPFFNTPSPQTNVLSASNIVVFTGTYDFPDVNQDGISDLFEQHYFNAVQPDHRPDIDSDADGMTDYQEFTAGTDPTNPSSALRMINAEIQPNRTVRLRWHTVPGHSYRVLLTTNLIDWLPTSSWTRASSTNGAITLPPLTDSKAYFFKVECIP